MWERSEFVGSAARAPSSIPPTFAFSESSLIRTRVEDAALRLNARPVRGGRLNLLGVYGQPHVTKYTGRMPASSEIQQNKLTIREAFPALPEGMEAEAEARLARYAALVYRIYERIREDPEKYAAFQQRLTEVSARDSMDSSGTLGPLSS